MVATPIVILLLADPPANGPDYCCSTTLINVFSTIFRSNSAAKPIHDSNTKDQVPQVPNTSLSYDLSFPDTSTLESIIQFCLQLPRSPMRQKTLQKMQQDILPNYRLLLILEGSPHSFVPSPNATSTDLPNHKITTCSSASFLLSISYENQNSQRLAEYVHAQRSRRKGQKPRKFIIAGRSVLHSVCKIRNASLHGADFSLRQTLCNDMTSTPRKLGSEGAHWPSAPAW